MLYAIINKYPMECVFVYDFVSSKKRLFSLKTFCKYVRVFATGFV